MKKIIHLFVVSLVLTFTLQAQITQERADEIVQERMRSEINPYTVYAKENVQTEGITIITSTGEEVELDYPCWVYYVKSYTAKTHNSYLIVKENFGNLLEVNVMNTEHPDDLEAWRVVKIPCSVEITAPCEHKSYEPKSGSWGTIEILYVDGKLNIKHYDAPLM